MNSKGIKLIATFLMIAFLFSISTIGLASSQPTFSQSNGKATITTDQATISVTGGGNVPFFHIQLNGTKTTTYEVKFSSIQEFVDVKGNGQFQNSEAVQGSGISLPSLNWNFGGFNTTNDTNGNIQTINFNFTTSGTPSLQLRNHIDVSKGNQIKFDLIVKNYAWKSTNSSAKLAVGFQISGGNLTKGSGANDLQFGEASFSSISTASTPDGNINVATQIASGNSFYLIYNHFNDSFEHDPTFSAVSSSGTASQTKGVGLELLPILAGLAVIGIVYTKKRYN